MDPVTTGQRYDTLAQHWQESYLQTNGLAQLARALQFTRKTGAALDIGCGSSGRFIEVLLKHGFLPEGLDVSEQMIALARLRHPGISFYHSDICSWNFSRKYDFISAWDSTWHLPLEQQEPVLRKICQNLNQDGIYLFTTGGVDGPQVKTDSFMGPELYYSVPGIPRFLELLTQFGCICRHLEYDQYPEPHLYIIAQKA